MFWGIKVACFVVGAYETRHDIPTKGPGCHNLLSFLALVLHPLGKAPRNNVDL